MMKRPHAAVSLDWDMTPMIDVVFLLMIFFVFTFKIVKQEGDFSIKMPLSGGNSSSLSLDTSEPVRIRLLADSNGELASIMMGDRSLGTSFTILRQQVMAYVGSLSPQARGEAEAELRCDYELKYKYTVDAMTAISGYYENGQIVPLIEKVKFAQKQGQSDLTESSNEEK
ncbi:MAG: biopolymer transporter ExbD [Planctomycetaceae bacterium]|jgi:biopolymer transport protein ExbD|nr:biopolymer transporter ExbD [Planctomycetaceae bacterium]